jgi:hypothetical protein
METKVIKNTIEISVVKKIYKVIYGTAKTIYQETVVPDPQPWSTFISTSKPRLKGTVA